MKFTDVVANYFRMKQWNTQQNMSGRFWDTVFNFLVGCYFMPHPVDTEFYRHRKCPTGVIDVCHVCTGRINFAIFVSCGYFVIDLGLNWLWVPSSQVLVNITAYLYCLSNYGAHLWCRGEKMIPDSLVIHHALCRCTVHCRCVECWECLAHGTGKRWLQSYLYIVAVIFRRLKILDASNIWECGLFRSVIR